MKITALALLAAWKIVAISAQTSETSAQDQLPPLKHQYKLSLKQPYFFLDDKTIPFYSTYGSVVPSASSIRLTPSIPDVKGSIWSNKPNSYKEWMADVAVAVHGQGHVGGFGMAIWYTKEPGVSTTLLHDSSANAADRIGSSLGHAYGSAETWQGFGLFLDSYDEEKHSRNMPFVYGILNDGSKSVTSAKEPEDMHRAGCYQNYRGVGVVHFRILYVGDTLSVSIDLKNGNGFQTCFNINNVHLPQDYYFGVSAETGRMPDDHDVDQINIYEVYKFAGQVEEPAKEEEKHYEEIRDKVQHMREEHENEIFHHDPLAHDFGHDGFGDSYGSSHELVKLQETQMKILDHIDAVFTKIDGIPAAVVAGGAPVDSHTTNSAPVSAPTRDAETVHELQRLKEKSEKVEANLSLLLDLVKDIASYVSHMGTEKSEGDQRHIADMLASLDHKISYSTLQAEQTRQYVDSKTVNGSSDGGWVTGIIVFLLGEVLILGLYAVWKQRQGEKAKKFI